jgi:hypothetical protein
MQLLEVNSENYYMLQKEWDNKSEVRVRLIHHIEDLPMYIFDYKQNWLSQLVHITIQSYVELQCGCFLILF